MGINLKDASFEGWRRENGRMGVRNHVIILPVDDLSNAAAEAVANNIKGAMAIPHAYGRLQFGADLELHFRTLIGTGSNPNVAGVIVIGIEPGWTGRIVEGIAKTGKPVEGFAIEQNGDINTIANASRAAYKLVKHAPLRFMPICRVPLPALRLDVVDVQVLAGADVLDRAADIHAVLDDGVARPDRPDRQLVADRDVRPGVELDHLVLVHDPAIQACAGLQALHHHHAHTVALVMDDEMDRHLLPPVACVPSVSRRLGPLRAPFNRPAQECILLPPHQGGSETWPASIITMANG